MDAPNFTRPQLTALIAALHLNSSQDPRPTWEVHVSWGTWLHLNTLGTAHLVQSGWECDGLGHRAEGIVRHGQGNQSKGLSCMTVSIIFSPGPDNYLHSSWISNYHNAKLYFSVISLQKMRLAIMSEIILLGDQLFWNCIAVTCLSLCLQGTSLCWMHPPPVHSLDLIFPGK